MDTELHNSQSKIIIIFSITLPQVYSIIPEYLSYNLSPKLQGPNDPQREPHALYGPKGALTDRKTHFTDRIPLLSICSVRTDRQTVYNHSCHENIISPTN